ncbi:MAG: type VI secretion system baseplate subunit TssF [Planctomycetes bacterium]|nr:type VI secretion system baseplate subunit TssF [Planctomycetota bacterium]
MSQPIDGFYEQELQFLEETAQAFAERYPVNAKHLVGERDAHVDPHLERMLEGFALLAGRVRHKIDSELPELTASYLQILYPHLSMMIPSMAIAQAQVTGAPAELKNGLRLEKNTSFRSENLGAGAFQYRLGYPLTIWPIELTDVSWETSPFEAGVRPPSGTGSLLRLRFACQDGLAWDDVPIDRLRLYLSGERQIIAALHETLLHRCLGVTFQAVDRGPGTATSRPPMCLPADECIFPVGFELDDGLLPMPPESFVGYRLLMEFLSFPQKHLFVDLAGWDQLHGRRFGGQVEVIFFFSQAHENFGPGLSKNNFLLGCAPIVNLFPRSVEPVDWDHHQSEYRVAAWRRQPRAMEIYRIERVRAIDAATGKAREIMPFYRSRFGRDDAHAPYYHATRRASIHEDVPGSEMYLALVDPDFHPSRSSSSVLDIDALCCNRDMAHTHQQAGDRMAAARPRGIHLELLHKPTIPLRPPMGRAAYWRLLAQNALNHVSLIGGEDSLAALRELLRLCDFSEPANRQLAAVNQQLIDGIQSIRSRPVMRQISAAGQAALCRGTEIAIDFDEEKYTGTGVLFMAAVLDRFFGLFAPVNSFTTLVVRRIQASGVLKQWPARSGAALV